VSIDREPMARPLTMNEAAEALGVSKRWLEQQPWLEGIPYLRCGHKRLFDEAALNAVREAMRNKCAPNSSTQKLGPRLITGSVGRNSASAVTEALRLATTGKRRR
jgi:excisionase family DNA binding protein